MLHDIDKNIKAVKHDNCEMDEETPGTGNSTLRALLDPVTLGMKIMAYDHDDDDDFMMTPTIPG